MAVDEMTAQAMRDVARLEQEVARLRDALSEIALAGMSGTGQESEEGMRDWHARRAWEFIGIAARALSPAPGVAEGHAPDLRGAAHELESAIRFAEHGLVPTADEVAEWKLALGELRRAAGVDVPLAPSTKGGA